MPKYNEEQQQQLLEQVYQGLSGLLPNEKEQVLHGVSSSLANIMNGGGFSKELHDLKNLTESQRGKVEDIVKLFVPTISDQEFQGAIISRKEFREISNTFLKPEKYTEEKSTIDNASLAEQVGTSSLDKSSTNSSLSSMHSSSSLESKIIDSQANTATNSKNTIVQIAQASPPFDLQKIMHEKLNTLDDIESKSRVTEKLNKFFKIKALGPEQRRDLTTQELLNLDESQPDKKSRTQVNKKETEVIEEIGALFEGVKPQERNKTIEKVKATVKAELTFKLAEKIGLDITSQVTIRHPNLAAQGQQAAFSQIGQKMKSSKDATFGR